MRTALRQITQRALPHPTYAKFFGRKKELKELLSLLDLNDRNYVISVEGPAGVGKTALVRALCETLIAQEKTVGSGDHAYRAIIWISAKRNHLTQSGIRLESRLGVRSEEIIKEISGHFVDINENNRASHLARKQIIITGLKDVPCLLILDNFESLEDGDLESFLRRIPQPSKVVITTRRRVDSSTSVKLGPLGKAALKSVLASANKRRGMQLDAETRERVLELSGGNPLGVEWIVGQLGRGYSINILETELRDGETDLADYCVAHYLSDTAGKTQEQVLAVFALLPIGLRRTVFPFMSSALDMEDIEFLDAVNDLSDNTIIQFVDPIVEYQIPILHLTKVRSAASGATTVSLVRACSQAYIQFLKEAVGDERTSTALEEGYALVDREIDNIAFLVDALADNKCWETVTQLVLNLGYYPHARGDWKLATRMWSVAANAALEGENSFLAARFMAYCAYVDVFRQRFGDARHWLSKAEKLYGLGKRDYQTASLLRLSALISIGTGDCEGVEDLLLEAKTIMEECSSLRGVARIMVELGHLNVIQGDYISAITILERAVHKATLGADYVELARANYFLGRALQTQSDHPSAIISFGKGLECSRRIGWTDHIAFNLEGLINSFVEEGMLDEARGLLTEPLRIYNSLEDRAGADRIRILEEKLNSVNQ